MVMAVTSSGSDATAQSGRASSAVMSAAGVDIRGDSIQGELGDAEKLFWRGGGTLVRPFVWNIAETVGKD